MTLEIIGIYDRKESLKVLAFDISQRYDDGKSLVLTDTDLVKPAGEILGVTREEEPVDAVKGAIDQERNISILEKVFLMTYEGTINGQVHTRGDLASQGIRGTTANFGNTAGNHRGI
jgi:hypothetical protein